MDKVGKSYAARKALFQKGLKDGRLTVQEILQALPPGTLTAAEDSSDVPSAPPSHA